jgi:hypothetical protein
MLVVSRLVAVWDQPQAVRRVLLLEPVLERQTRQLPLICCDGAAAHDILAAFCFLLVSAVVGYNARRGASF